MSAGKELSHVPESGRSDYFEVRVASLRAPIRLEYLAIRELRTAFDANTEGLGLLLGSASPQAVSIHRCELLALSPATVADPKLLQAACRQFIRARLQTPLEEAPALLGFFRTQPAGAARLRDSDLEIVRTNFPGLDAIFLLIQSPPDRPWLSSLYILDGKTESGAAELAHEFPFDEYLLRNGFVSALVESHPPAVAPGFLAKPQNRRNSIIAAALLAILFGGLAAYKWYSPADRAGAARNVPAAGPLNLKVNRSGKDFEISWNLLSPAIQQADSGKLTIQDGALTRPVVLTGPQLREGRILYTPLFDELNFRLEVTSPNQDAVAESVQVLAWSGKQQADVLVVAPAQPETNSPARIVASDSGKPIPPGLPSVIAPSSRKETGPITTPMPAAKAAPAVNTPATSKGPAATKGGELASVRPPSTPPAAAVVSSSQPNSGPVRETAPVPPARPLDVQQNVQQTTPPAAAPTRPPAIRTSPQLPVTPPPSPAPKAPEPQAEAPAVRQNSTPPVATTSSAPSTTSASSVAIAPVPIQRVTPVLPRTVSGAVPAIARAITVSVRMMIDSAGSVQSAQVMASSPKGVFGEAAIYKAALEAAKNWKFRPGQLNGNNVAAEYDIDFKF